MFQLSICLKTIELLNPRWKFGFKIKKGEGVNELVF